MTTLSPADGAVFNLRPSGCPVESDDAPCCELVLPAGTIRISGKLTPELLQTVAAGHDKSQPSGLLGFCSKNVRVLTLDLAA